MKFNNYSLIIILFQYINNIFEYKSHIFDTINDK